MGRTTEAEDYSSLITEKSASKTRCGFFYGVTGGGVAVEPEALGDAGSVNGRS